MARCWVVLDDQLALAGRALDAVRADLDRSGSVVPTFEVDLYNDSVVRIRVDGSFTTPSMWATDEAEAFAEVGEYVQDQLAPDACWPTCAQHDAGLHAEVRDGVAMWYCRIGGHVAAAIGALGE